MEQNILKNLKTLENWTLFSQPVLAKTAYRYK